MLSKKDINQLEEQGKDIRLVEQQINNFRKGFPYMRLVKPATIGDGIIKLTPTYLEECIRVYEDALEHLKVIKFVPASGAASRMFKSLYAFLESRELTDDIEQFISNIRGFAFFEDLCDVLSKNKHSIDTLLDNQQYDVIVDHLLTEKGLNYGNLPKGLLKFHRYKNKSRTSMEEHLVEGATYASGKVQSVHLHFTVSLDHEVKFREQLITVMETYEKEYHVMYSVHFSQQKSATDTIAVDLENQPFYLEDGTILFRPAGHGALIENLNDLDGDVVFIKNIDNVVPDKLKPVTIRFKKALAGVLLEFQVRIFEYLKILENEDELSPSVMEEINEFLKKELAIIPPKGDLIDARGYFMKKLNRPVRVCGMVKNEGEPGGGPFWVFNMDGSISTQVVESAQVDPDDQEQQVISGKATHFNPVDLICTLKNHKGEKFDLQKYVDPETGFVSLKSQSGRDLKAQELPGLWNGSMSDWNTIFVEVPIETFNPVKVVNDLLRPQHQG